MTANPESILDSTKQLLGVESDDASFDVDITAHINTALGTLNQLSIGPAEGFIVEDRTALWADFTPDMRLLPGVKSYVYTSVKMLFDPPPTSFGIDAVRKSKEELEWRLNVGSEAIHPPTDPDPVPVEPEGV